MFSSSSSSFPSSSPSSSSSSSTLGNKVFVTNRALLPFYNIDDVARFCEIFSAADEDQEGDLDIDEWYSMFKKINKDASAQHARMIFMRLDDDNR